MLCSASLGFYIEISFVILQVGDDPRILDDANSLLKDDGMPKSII